MIILLLIIIYFIKKPFFKISVGSQKVALLLMLYICLDVFRICFAYEDNSIKENVLYIVNFLLLALIAVVFYEFEINSAFVKILIGISIINIFICIIEFFTNSLFFSYIKDENNVSLFQSINVGEFTRATGLFASGLACGAMLVFTFDYFFCKLLYCNKGGLYKKVVYIMALIVTAIAVYSTRTRNVILFFTLNIIFILFYKFVLEKIRIKLVYYLVVFLIAAAVVILPWFLSSAIFQFDFNLDILKSDTLLVRLYSWKNYFINFNSRNKISKLFGMGNVDLVYTDNAYLKLVAVIGIIGCVFYVFYVCSILYNLLQIKNKDFLTVAMICFVVTSFFIGVGNYYEDSYNFIIFILSILVISENKGIVKFQKGYNT